ncbi:MAG: DUF4097 domain-containing protein [Terriglobia bacterium]
MKLRVRGSKTILSLAVVVVGVLSTALAVAAGPFSAEGSFERTLQVTGPVDLDVTTGSGRITVRPGDAGTVQVRGTIKVRRGWFGGRRSAEEKVRTLEANPPIEQDGNVIRIGHIEDRALRRNVSISYDLVVPAETQLRSHTGSGSQSIEGIRGPVNADTGSGSLTISGIGSDVRAHTGAGNIELDSIQGSVRADTGSGSIRGIAIAGGFWADTGSGSVRVELTAAGDVEIETGSGSVEVRGVRGAVRVSTGSGRINVAGAPAGDWKLGAGSGSITVRLPAEAAFDFYTRTGSGRIYTDHPITVQGSIGRRELRGQVRGGGFRLEVRTGSGNIRIQ